MSDIIHLLPDSVANQIAAGEVIQRPASIIKELVENSLDAGATHIQVVVEDAGKTLVQVIDNGGGMSETDARLSFERHATSKIRQATDLFALHTMGFRGEALASIAAVAQVELRTRLRGTELGTRLLIEGSKVISQEPASCPEGANFSVRNLFFNIPARRKFLKSNQTELTNILVEFERIALAHPDVAFTLHSGGNLMLDLPAGNFRQRIVGVFGRKIDQYLIPVKVETTLANINGFIGMPEAARRKNAHQYLFVNGRFMRHPYFAKAIQSAYERLIKDGLQMPFFLTFDVDPSRIDVNIHPTKTEIKFEDDNAIFQILLAAVRESLGKYGAVPMLDFDAEARPDFPAMGDPLQAAQHIAPPQIHIDPTYNPFNTGNNGSGDRTEYDGRPLPSAYSYQRPAVPVNWQNVYNQSLEADATGREGQIIPSAANTDAANIFSSSTGASQEADFSASLFGTLTDEEQKAWSEVGYTDFLQYAGRYILTPFSEGLAMIDQTRAHTRVLYEQYLQMVEKRKAPSSRLLLPEMLTLSPSESSILESLRPSLQTIGFDISPLGGGSYSLLAVPTDTDGVAPSALLQTILADAAEGHADTADTLNHLIASAMSRKLAMPVGEALSKEEMRRLVTRLLACKLPRLTPDGKPTFVIIKPDTLF